MRRFQGVALALACVLALLLAAEHAVPGVQARSSAAATGRRMIMQTLGAEYDDESSSEQDYPASDDDGLSALLEEITGEGSDVSDVSEDLADLDAEIQDLEDSVDDLGEDVSDAETETEMYDPSPSSDTYSPSPSAGLGGDGEGEDVEYGYNEEYDYDFDAYGFDDGEEEDGVLFSSFCEDETTMKAAVTPCDIIVRGIDERILESKLKVDGVYRPVGCMDGFLKYGPIEGEDVAVLAYGSDFGEWGFYNETWATSSSLMLHSDSFGARVPQEAEAWYCDLAVCEETEDEDYWTPITDVNITCITEEQEAQRVRFMGKRKKPIPKNVLKASQIRRRQGQEESAVANTTSMIMLAMFVIAAGGIVLGIPLYYYRKGRQQRAVQFQRLRPET